MVSLKNKGILLVTVFLVCLFSVSAFNVEYESIENKINRDGTAKFKVIVENDMDITDTFRIYSGDYKWDMLTDPLSDYYSGFTIGPNSNKELKLFLNPYDSLYPGRFGVSVNVKSENTGVIRHLFLPVDIKSPYGDDIGEYIPVVIITGDINGNNYVNPKETSKITLKLDNRNSRNISSATIDISNDFYEKTIQTNILPLEKKYVDFNFDVDPKLAPGDYNFDVVLSFNNKTVEDADFAFSVLPYSSIVRDDSVKHSWFKYDKTINIVNEGNIKNTDSIKVEISSIKSFFTKSEPKAEIVKENGAKYLVWDYQLIPYGDINLKYTVNYRPLLYFILAVIASIILYYLLRSPVVVKKQSINIKMYDGGLSEMKILIHVKNRTPKNYSDIVLGERVPNIASYIPTESMGNIMPSKVLKHDQKGTILKWNLETLDPFEERIIIYKVKSKLTILGRFIIPSTVVKFKDDMDSEYVVHSNKLKITNIGKR